MAKPIIALYNGNPGHEEGNRIAKKLEGYHVFFFSEREDGEQIKVFNLEDSVEDLTIEELKKIVNG